MFNNISKIKIVFGVAATLVLGSTSSAFAKGGDGSGFSGPNMAPDSIPVSLDRGVMTYEVSRAINICFATGDEKTGLKSLLQKLADQITKGNPYQRIFSFYGRSDYDRDSKTWETYADIIEGAREIFDRDRYYKKLQYRNDGSHQKGDQTSSGLFTFNRELITNLSSEVTPGAKLLLLGGLPLVKFKDIAPDTGYDDLGNNDNNYLVLIGVYIELPKDYGTSVKLYNANTGNPSALTVNLVEYAECLKGQIQKSLK